GRGETAKGRVIPQTVVNGKIRRRSPGILGIKSQPLHVLRETAISGRSAGAGCSWRHLQPLCRSATKIHSELLRIIQVFGGVLRERGKRFRSSRERSAQHRLMNKIHPGARRVLAGSMGHAITKLILLLIAQHRKGSDGSNKLIVAEGFKSRYRL